MVKIAWHPSYHLPLPEGHRFPMEKYSLLPEQLIYEGTCKEEQFFKPEVIEIRDLELVHTTPYIHDVLECNIDSSMIRRIGLPLSELLVERERRIMKGTIDAALYALEYGLAYNIAGGTHHAFADRGEGFCIFNDNAIAAQYLIQNQKANKILIVDLDVHQGNGTAAIGKGNDQVFTFSMHGASNYPFHKETSDLDIPLPDGCTDAIYHKLLDQYLPQLIDLVEPDFIFYQCGVDILGDDKMGKLNCTLKGCMERDRKVLQLAYRHCIPVVCDMGGGYAANIKTILEAHANTYRIGMELFA